MPVKKRKLEDLSIDEFMAEGLESDFDEDESAAEVPIKQKKKRKVKDKEIKSPVKTKKAHDHKESLEKLKNKDPEFYEFLKQEDKSLLDFNASDESGSSSAEEDEEEELEDAEAEIDSDDLTDDEEKVHTLPQELEVASDSESEDGEEEIDEVQTTQTAEKKTKVTMKMVNQWCANMQEKNSLTAIHQAVSAFKAAVHQSGGDEKKVVDSKYKVIGGAVFNAIVRMCITDMYPALLRVLEITKEKAGNDKKMLNLNKKTKWKKLKLDVKSYLADLLHLAGFMAEPSILNVILKHIYQLTNFYAHFPKLVKSLIKTLVAIWSSGDETSRVLAFLSINSVTRKLQDTFLEYVLKQMYMSYVKNCKFTSPTTLPLINFMQRSLVEIFAVDTAVTYQYAFVYIRQLAIHLRNAITTKSKETTAAVYNWQYMHSLQLWARLISQLWPNQTLEPLIYPLVQVILGTIKLVPSPYYYPLRFHCVKALNMVSESTGTFIPTLPLLTEILEMTDFAKKPKSTSIKPYNLTCILKFSKGETSDKAFLDGVMDTMYDHLLETFTMYSHTVGFPEVALPAVLVMKSFVKQDKLPNNYRKVIRQLLEKVQQTTQTVTQRRKKATLSLADSVAMNAWERKSKNDGTPLSKYYAQYRKKRDIEIQKEIVDRDRDLIKSEELPMVNRRKVLEKATAKERQEFRGLFASDEEGSSEDDESDEEERFLPKKDRTKKIEKKEAKSESSDEYSDLDDADMAALDCSASEDEAGEDESEAEDDDSEAANDNEDADANDDLNDSDDADIVEDFAFSDEDSE